MIERTFCFIKPDGVKRGLVGRILARFEEKGLRLVRLQLLRLDRRSAEELYAPHRGKPFFEELVSYVTSGPIVAFVLEGENATAEVRRMIGATDPLRAEPGTVRWDYGLSITMNTIHASDSEESYRREASVLFPDLLSKP